MVVVCMNVGLGEFWVKLYSTPRPAPNKINIHSHVHALDVYSSVTGARFEGHFPSSRQTNEGRGESDMLRAPVTEE
jgi:hypothetical protein